MFALLFPHLKRRSLINCAGPADDHYRVSAPTHSIEKNKIRATLVMRLSALFPRLRASTNIRTAGEMFAGGTVFSQKWNWREAQFRSKQMNTGGNNVRQENKNGVQDVFLFS